MLTQTEINDILPLERPSFDLLFHANTIDEDAPETATTLELSGSESETDNEPNSATLPPSLSDSWDRLSAPSTSSDRAASPLSASLNDAVNSRDTLTAAQPLHQSIQSSQTLSDRQSNKDIEELQITESLTCTWLGQATTFLTINGLCILTDPIFTDELVPGWRPKRLRPPGCRLEELERGDVVVLSHSHPDHLSVDAVKYLQNSVLWVIPLGLEAWFRWYGVTNVLVFDWWQSQEVTLRGRTLKITATPAMVCSLFIISVEIVADIAHSIGLPEHHWIRISRYGVAL